jgi:hypothetical protein
MAIKTAKQRIKPAQFKETRGAGESHLATDIKTTPPSRRKFAPKATRRPAAPVRESERKSSLINTTKNQFFTINNRKLRSH